MIPGPWPDVAYGAATPILCPDCLRPTYYALNTDRYVCAVDGPVVGGEDLPRHNSKG